MNSARSRHRLIEKLKGHPNFSKPEVIMPLLEFLNQCADEGIIPDEKMIAARVFNKGDAFDPSSDTLVRVYMSKLRKKLATYFQGEGSSEKFRLEIPKGNYRLETVSNKKPDSSEQNRVALIKSAAIVFLLILNALFAYQLLSHFKLIEQKNRTEGFEKDSFIWSKFLASEIPTSVVLGQILMFSEFDERFGYSRMIRDPLVFSLEGFSKYAEDHQLSEEEIDMADYENIPESGLRNFARIQPMFQLSSNPLEVEISSDLSWEQIKTRNIIYLGHFHNLGMTEAFFPNTHFYSPTLEIDYETLKKNMGDETYIKAGKNRTLQVFHDDKETTYVFEGKGAYTRDYVVVAKVPGPDQKTLLYIVSFHQIGRMEVVKALTDFEALSEIKKQILDQYGEIPPHFGMLMEVEGFEDTAMKTTLKHFFPLPSKVAIEPVASYR